MSTANYLSWLKKQFPLWSVCCEATYRICSNKSRPTGPSTKSTAWTGSTSTTLSTWWVLTRLWSATRARSLISSCTIWRMARLPWMSSSTRLPGRRSCDSPFYDKFVNLFAEEDRGFNQKFTKAQLIRRDSNGFSLYVSLWNIVGNSFLL